ncbi:MAG: riboflavin synthase [Betaproteobacteria bacterium]|nr:MAG: riboflavin synthase [Betaproteobacteria bacterium]
MFTGIVQAVGRIASATPHGDGLRIAVEAAALGVDGVKAGDSIAVAGCCLTVVAVERDRLCFDVSAETLSCTTGLDRTGRVNLEPALRLSDRLGGHLVSGHVDGIGSVIRAEVAGAADGSRVLEIEAPVALLRFIAPKGSVAVDGVSLTVNTVAPRHFAVNLIPHTLTATTLRELTRGARVNLEVDLVARYVARLHEAV